MMIRECNGTTLHVNDLLPSKEGRRDQYLAGALTAQLSRLARGRNVVVSQNGGPQYELHSTIVLISGTPKKVPLILGNPHVQNTPEGSCCFLSTATSNETSLLLSTPRQLWGFPKIKGSFPGSHNQD